jgi:hypothetical protein
MPADSLAQNFAAGLSFAAGKKSRKQPHAQ